MGRLLTSVFTVISGVCALLLISSFVHFICGVNQKRKGQTVDSLVKKCAFVSLFGYTTFVVISFALYLIQSLYYIPSLHIQYSTLLCQLQTFNIVFFMTGKLAMYFYFMALVHVAFRGSFLAYPVKIIGSMAICFFFLMCIIGGFYMVFLYIDFSSVGHIDSPADCDKFEASKYSQITIWTGATCDAIWSFTCLLLFYLRLRKITKLMTDQRKIERKETEEMLQQIEIKCRKSAKSLPNINISHNRTNTRSSMSASKSLTNVIICLKETDIMRGARSLPTPTPVTISNNMSGLSTVHELNDNLEQLSPSTSPSATPPPKPMKSDGNITVSTLNGTNVTNSSHCSTALIIAPDGGNIGMDLEETVSVSGTEMETEEYSLMKCKYATAPRIVAYDRKNSQSSSNKMLVSLKLKFDITSNKIKKKIKRRNSWSVVREKSEKKKPDIVHKFLPIMLKLSILSAWCAFSTFGLGFGLWTLYPTLSSIIDSTINAFCVYLSFGFTKVLYEWLCLPFISCKNCESYRNVVHEANKMENDKNYETKQNVLG